MSRARAASANVSRFSRLQSPQMRKNADKPRLSMCAIVGGWIGGASVIVCAISPIRRLDTRRTEAPCGATDILGPNRKQNRGNELPMVGSAAFAECAFPPGCGRRTQVRSKTNLLRSKYGISQRFSHFSNKRDRIDRLYKKGGDAKIRSLPFLFDAIVPGKQDNGTVDTPSRQFRDKFKARKAGHINIRNNTADAVCRGCRQQLNSRRMGDRIKTF